MLYTVFYGKLPTSYLSKATIEIRLQNGKVICAFFQKLKNRT